MDKKEEIMDSSNLPHLCFGDCERSMAVKTRMMRTPSAENVFEDYHPTYLTKVVRIQQQMSQGRSNSLYWGWETSHLQ